jgi:hypothetical protein
VLATQAEHPYDIAAAVLEACRRTWLECLKEAPHFSNVVTAALIVLYELNEIRIIQPDGDAADDVGGLKAIPLSPDHAPTGLLIAQCCAWLLIRHCGRPLNRCILSRLPMTKRPNTPFDLGFESGREVSLFAWCTVSIAQTCSEINTLQRRHALVGGTHTNDVGELAGGCGWPALVLLQK